MATLGTANPTLLDVAKRMDPGGRIPIIAEMQTKINPIHEDMPMIESNEMTGHVGVIRTGLPSNAWRLLNYGTIPTKSRTKQVRDACGIIEAFSEIDEEVYNLNGASGEFRMSEDVAHIESMGQTVAEAIFYGNQQTDPEQITGLTPRFSDTTAENGGQIIDAGGSADRTSIWMISWSPRTIHGIYPKGSMAGLEYKNLGLETKEDTNGRLLRVYRSQFKQKTGLHLKDWQSVVRIANIDTGELADAAETGSDAPQLLHKMITAWYTIPLRLRQTGTMAFYVNPIVKAALVKLATLTLGANTLTVTQLESGEPLLRFWGIPIRECDALISAEDAVS